MLKKAATRVAAFLLSNGGSRMENKDIYAKNVVNYTHGGMKVSVTISFLLGLSNGYSVSKQ
jgi:hypothetical protein